MTQHYAMPQRNLLYTGVTRGKKRVVLVGQKKAVAIAVRNVSGRRRWSKFSEWLASKKYVDVPLAGASQPPVTSSHPSNASAAAHSTHTQNVHRNFGIGTLALSLLRRICGSTLCQRADSHQAGHEWRG